MELEPPSLSRLLALPRELHDMIVDDVLIGSNPLPKDCLFPCIPDRWSHNFDRGPWNFDRRSCNFDSKIHIPPLCPNPGLLQTCLQLRAETMQRAGALDVPLILDVLVLSNGRVRCTWLNIPCRRSWEGVRMEINVRIGLNSLNGAKRGSRDCSDCLVALYLRETTITQALKTALLQTLRATDRNTAIVGLRINMDIISSLPRREDSVEENERPGWDWILFTRRVMRETCAELFGEDDSYDPTTVLEKVWGVEW